MQAFSEVTLFQFACRSLYGCSLPRSRDFYPIIFLCNMHVLLRNLAYKSCVCYCVVFAIELLRNGLAD